MDISDTALLSEQFFSRLPKQYNWRPKPDITVYELALAVPVLLLRLYDIETAVKSLPESVQRHFEEAV